MSQAAVDDAVAGVGGRTGRSSDMVNLQVPAASADATEHADWLELTAVTAADLDSSTQADLATAIRRTGSIDAMHDPEKPDDDEPLDSLVEREDEELERVADAAFEELERRWEYLGDAYPFSVDGALRADVHAAASPYVFLTALTHFGLQTDVAPESAASLFELVSEAALVEYLGGASAQSYPFGFPRRDSPRAFRDAGNDPCRELGEGVECGVSRAQRRTPRMQSSTSWCGCRTATIVRTSGACLASVQLERTGGQDRNELQPVDFCKTWLRVRSLRMTSSRGVLRSERRSRNATGIKFPPVIDGFSLTA